MAESIDDKNNSKIDTITSDDYREALLKLTWPTMVSMAFTVIYNLIDSVWVAGLGPDTLAAVGFISPLFLILTGLGNGVGIGANALISQYIGVKDYENASNSSMHSLVLAVIISIIGAIIMYFLLPVILHLMGASGTIFNDGMRYGRILFTFMIVFIYSSVSSGILRGEGDGKMVMYALIITSIINIVLDPIFIYGFNMGVSGAALTTVLSVLINCIIFFDWTMIRKNNFIKIDFERFSYNSVVIRRILRITIPSLSETVLMSCLGIVIIYILSLTSGSSAVAVYTVNYKLLELGLVPIIGISQALLTLTATSAGANDFVRLKNTYYHAMRLGIVVGIVIAVAFFITAPVLCQIFAYGESAILLPEIITSLRILCFWIVGTTFGLMGSMFFQGISRGYHSLFLTFIRAFLLELVFTWILDVVFQLSNNGVYFCVTFGCIIGGLISFLYTSRYLETNKRFKQGDNTI